MKNLRVNVNIDGVETPAIVRRKINRSLVEGLCGERTYSFEFSVIARELMRSARANAAKHFVWPKEE
jgi:hypothetical protein